MAGMPISFTDWQKDSSGMESKHQRQTECRIFPFSFNSSADFGIGVYDESNWVPLARTAEPAIIFLISLRLEEGGFMRFKGNECTK
jgi:hypothetical protein